MAKQIRVQTGRKYEFLWPREVPTNRLVGVVRTIGYAGAQMGFIADIEYDPNLPFKTLFLWRCRVRTTSVAEPMGWFQL